ncbi:MAG: dipeptide epimerase [Chitinophagaceae bacterium]|nr:dipeptide epimerase [Chitinophagaceae bacterium]
MKVKYFTYELKFRYPFTISRGTKTHQPTFISELEHFGIKGYGEAPEITYYNIPLKKMAEDLENKKRFLEKFAFTEPERFWHYVHHLFPENHFLVCALDIAGWDLYGKLQNKPLYRLWGGDSARSPVTDYTIGIDTPEKMLQKIREKPWPVYKVKVGTPDDLSVLTLLRQHTDAAIRIDANGGWNVNMALDLIPRLQELGVELIEQPLPKEDREGMKKLFEFSSIPLIADESCVAEQDVEKCYGYFHGINIKLTKCGGITPARRMIEKARKLNLKVMIGCMCESTVGTAATAHLLPFIDYADMDGPLLLEEDIAKGIEYDYGKIKIPDAPGLGIIFCGIYKKKNL